MKTIRILIIILMAPIFGSMTPYGVEALLDVSNLKVCYLSEPLGIDQTTIYQIMTNTFRMKEGLPDRVPLDRSFLYGIIILKPDLI